MLLNVLNSPSRIDRHVCRVLTFAEMAKMRGPIPASCPRWMPDSPDKRINKLQVTGVHSRINLAVKKVSAYHRLLSRFKLSKYKQHCFQVVKHYYSSLVPGPFWIDVISRPLYAGRYWSAWETMLCQYRATSTAL